MHIDFVLLSIAGVAGIALLLAYAFRSLGLPVVAAYIATGMMAGPSGLGLVHDAELLRHIGELGVIMLMFFIGMEIDLPRLVAGWRIAVLGTLLQMLISVAVCVAGAMFLHQDWRIGLLFGFILSMSSTAVVLTILKDTNELDTGFGQNALGVLLMQDLMIVPIMIGLGMLGEHRIEAGKVIVQLVGGTLLIALAVWLMRGVRWTIPKRLISTEDKRILFGLVVCFSAAALTSSLGLSAPFGAFLAGMILHDSDQARWVEEHLRSLYLVFLAVFFLSVGMLIDLSFVMAHWPLVLGGAVAVFVLNSGLNALVLRALGERWTMALLTGGLLSQIGELSFLLASIGLSSGILSSELHRIVVAIIALTLMLSPAWVLVVRRIVRPEVAVMRTAEMEARVQQMAEELRARRERIAR